MTSTVTERKPAVTSKAAAAGWPAPLRTVLAVGVCVGGPVSVAAGIADHDMGAAAFPAAVVVTLVLARWKTGRWV